MMAAEPWISGRRVTPGALPDRDPLTLTNSEPWMVDGLCAQTDPEAFFPDKGGTTKPAKAICHGCPVTEECLTYALDSDQRFGIWGGHSERERRKLKKRRARGDR